MGTVTKVLSLDPDEYRGLTADQLRAAIEVTLLEVAPDVVFSEWDVQFAVEQLNATPR